MHKAGETARTIAALLYLGTVGVVDNVFKVDVRIAGWAHAKNLVGTDTKMAVAQEAVMGRCQPQAAGRFVQDHKVVSCALHFGELNSHGPIIDCAERVITRASHCGALWLQNGRHGPTHTNS